MKVMIVTVTLYNIQCHLFYVGSGEKVKEKNENIFSELRLDFFLIWLVKVGDIEINFKEKWSSCFDVKMFSFHANDVNWISGKEWMINWVEFKRS